MNLSIKDIFMRLNLGSILKIWSILALTALFAEDFSYTFKLSKNNPYVKEAVVLTLDIVQTNPAVVLLFNFNLKKSDDYFFQRLDAKETDTHHSAKVHYSYLVYPLRDGAVDIEFELLKRVTNDESVAYSFSGDRDNGKTLETKDTAIVLKPLRLEVQALPKGTLLVGNFKLTSEFKKHEASAYEALPFKVTIEGEGYPPLLDTLIPKSTLFTLFKEQPIEKTVHSIDGTHSSVLYPMALLALKSFDFDSIEIEAFNPKDKRSYLLKIPKQHFSIVQESVDNLVDKSDNPAPLESNWSWLKSFFVYLLVFISGYMTSFILKDKKRKVEKDLNPLYHQIDSCRDEKELFKLLMSKDSKKFIRTIEELENFLYKEGKMNFKKLKEKAKEEI
jgi:hypothetical protein